MEILVLLFFVVVFAVIVIQLYQSASEWAHNNSQPVLTVPVKLVAKRDETNSYGSRHARTRMRVRTTYYATFEFETGERREFSISGNEYGMLAEGDEGNLTYQGTRYHGFERH